MSLPGYIGPFYVDFNEPICLISSILWYPFGTFAHEGPIHMIELGFQWETGFVHEYANAHCFFINSCFTTLTLYTSQRTKLQFYGGNVSRLEWLTCHTVNCWSGVHLRTCRHHSRNSNHQNYELMFSHITELSVHRRYTLTSSVVQKRYNHVGISYMVLGELVNSLVTGSCGCNCKK